MSWTCPDCEVEQVPDSEYCAECGLRAPARPEEQILSLEAMNKRLCEVLAKKHDELEETRRQLAAREADSDQKMSMEPVEVLKLRQKNAAYQTNLSIRPRASRIPQAIANLETTVATAGLAVCEQLKELTKELSRIRVQG